MRKIYNIFLSCLITIMTVPLNPPLITKAETLYFDGNGTTLNPYRIESEDDLITLSKLVASTDANVANTYANASYIQTADIELTEEFVPIGTHPGVGFYGTYDGNYCSITELNIDASGSYIGLFGWVKSGTIKNLSVYGEVHSIEAENSYSLIGGLVGEICDGAAIVNCSFNGTVSSDDNNVGGLAGQIARGASITGSYFNGTVNGNQNVGGLVGYVSDQTVESSISITHSYMAGQVSSTSTAESVGAIAGNIVTANESSVISVNSNLYLYSACDGAVNSNSYIGCTKAGDNALKAWIDVLGSPFIVNTESDNFNDGYPIFEWQSTPYQFKGSGTASDPYQISSKEELMIMRNLINSEYSSSKYNACYYVQTADIDLENMTWEPIGVRLKNGKNAPSFYGSYNGQGYSIINLYVNRAEKFAGLFGSFNGNGAIENLIVYGEINSTANSTGGICGEICNGGGIIKNCAFIGDVNGALEATGGVVGYAWQSSTVENCYHNGSVTSSTNNSAGGVVGKATVGSDATGDVNIRNCYHVGTLTSGKGATGGVVGYTEERNNFTGSVYISNCYYLKNSAAVGVNGTSTECETTALTSNLLKNAYLDLGSAYAKNLDADFNDGYPIFQFQLYEGLSGDVNSDGKFNVADIVMMQKWLYCAVDLTDWKAGDICKDDRIDVFDLCLMKRLLINMGGGVNYTLTLNKTSASLELEGDASTLHLEATVQPESTKIIWKSSNTSVAKVSDDGLIKAVGTGTAIITAKTEIGGKTASCRITVVDPSIKIDKSSIDLYVGGTATLNATVVPTGSTVTWKSADTSVATVSGGKITAVAAGKTTITAKITVNGKEYSASCTVNVNKVEPSNITIKSNPTKMSYYKGDTLNTSGLSLTVTYNNGTSKTIDSGFTCTPTSLTTVGTEKITVSYNGKTTSFNVTVAEVKVSSISIKSNPTKTSYYKGDTLNTAGLSITVKYNNGTSTTVNSGFTCTPTALNTVGTQKITVSYGGMTTSFNVTVAEVKVSSISVKTNPSKTTYFIGDTLNTSGLILNVKYNNGTSQTISSGFSCSPTSLGTAGTQKITVTYSGVSTSFNVTVNLRTYVIKSSTGAKVRDAAGTSNKYVGALACNSVVYYDKTAQVGEYTWYHIVKVDAAQNSWGVWVNQWVPNV